MTENHSHQKNEDQFVGMLNGFVGLLALGVLVFLGLYMVSQSLDKVASGLGDVALKIEKLKLAVTVSGASGSSSQEPQKPSSITLQGQTFSLVELSGLDLGKAAAVKGNPDSGNIMLTFSDYQCPFCRTFWRAGERSFIKEYVDSGKGAIYFFDFPLPYHPGAVPMANAARCAGEQGKYWEMRDALNELQDKNSTTATVSVSADQIKQLGVELGLDTSKYNSCVDSVKYSNQINENAQLGQALGVGGTPTSILNSYLIPGAFPYPLVKELAEKTKGTSS